MMPRALSVVTLCAVFLALTLIVCPQEDGQAPLPAPWPKFHGDLGNSGLSKLSGPAQPTLLWRFDAHAPVLSSPAIAADGSVYFTAGDSLFVLGADGGLKLKYLLGPTGPSSPALAADGTAYVGTPVTGRLLAITPGVPEGAPAGAPLMEFKWYKELGRPVDGSPTVARDGSIYVGCDDGSLYALTPEGEVKWGYAVGEPVKGCPAIAEDGTIYVCGSDFGLHLHALKPDGSPKWRTDDQLSYHFSPVISPDGSIVACSEWGNVTCLHTDGSVLWDYEMQGEAAMPCAGPAIGPDGTVYVGGKNKQLYALSSAGQLEWQCDIGAPATCSPVVDADGVVYVGAEDGKLTAVTPEGKIRWQFATGGAVRSTPAIGVGGVLHFGADDGFVYAVAASPAADQ